MNNDLIIKTLAQQTLSPAKIFILLTCELIPSQMSHIARSLNMSPAGITGAIDSLEKESLVIRKRNATDRRLVQISTTAKGIARLSKIRAKIEAAMKEEKYEQPN